MNVQHDRIAALCAELKLYRISGDWAAIAQDAARSEDSFGYFVERLLSTEAQARGERQRQTLLKLATLPVIKTLEQFDFAFASGVRAHRSRNWPHSPSSSAPRTSCCSDRAESARATSRSRLRTER